MEEGSIEILGLGIETELATSTRHSHASTFGFDVFQLVNLPSWAVAEGEEAPPSIYGLPAILARGKMQDGKI